MPVPVFGFLNFKFSAESNLKFAATEYQKNKSKLNLNRLWPARDLLGNSLALASSFKLNSLAGSGGSPSGSPGRAWQRPLVA